MCLEIGVVSWRLVVKVCHSMSSLVGLGYGVLVKASNEEYISVKVPYEDWEVC